MAAEALTHLGCLRKRGTMSRRCVHNNTQQQQQQTNTNAESHSQKLNSNVARASCRGSAGRLRLPKTHPNTRTYGTTKSSYVHAYIGKDGKRRKRVQRRKSEKRKPPRARRAKILNYQEWPRRPCRNSMNRVTYKNVIRTSPGGAYAHMRTHDGEIEVPTLVPSHRRVKNR